MEKFNAKVIVTLKPEIKDIKALTLEQAVSSIIKVDDLKCRAGNIYNISFSAQNRDTAQKIINTIAEEILSNSVIEEYKVQWEE